MSAPIGDMTLRDYFAAKALYGLMDLCRQDHHTGTYVEHVAKLAYETADAMLKAKES